MTTRIVLFSSFSSFFRSSVHRGQSLLVFSLFEQSRWSRRVLYIGLVVDSFVGDELVIKVVLELGHISCNVC